MLSVIETSALQKLCQCYSSYKTQQCPGKGNVEIEIFLGIHADEGTETYYNDTQNVNSYGSVRGAGAPAYPVQA